MLGFSDLNESFWHIQGVARSLGVSLTDAIADGRLKRGDYGRIVMRCRDCPNGSACADWLGRPCARDARAPGFCRNRQELDRIRAMDRPPGPRR